MSKRVADVIIGTLQAAGVKRCYMGPPFATRVDPMQRSALDGTFSTVPP